VDGEFRQKAECVSALGRGFMHSEILFAANDAGVFALLEEDRTASQIAQALGWPARSARMLLDALAALELVTRSGDHYRNAPAASACLVPGRPAYQGNLLRHHANIARLWAHLGEALETGEAVPRDVPERTPEQLRAFILGMHDVAKLSAPEIVGAVDVSACRHMLDLGGGPATHTMAFLEANPAMKATVFDRPAVLDIAREEVARAGLQDRVSFLAGDIVADDYGTGYDFVLVSNVIHSFGADKNRRMVQKCYDALVPGGLLVLRDFLTDNDRSGPRSSLIFALNMLVAVGEGDTYSFAQVDEWTREAGFIEGRSLELAPQTRLWMANKP